MSGPDLGDDEVLLANLSAAIDEGDPIPAAAIELAVAGFGLRQLDEQLAQLVEDSPVLLRREPAATRALSFAAAALSIEVEIDLTEGVVVGMISPPESTPIEVESVRVNAAHQTTSMRSDELGRFRATVGPGLCRLHFHPAGPAVVTPWFSL